MLSAELISQSSNLTMDTTQERALVPSHTPKPLPDHLRSELTSALLSNSTIPVIQSTLYNTSRDAGWIKSVHERAKHLINSGQMTSLQEVSELLIKESREGIEITSSLPGGLRRVRQNVDSADGGTGEVELASDRTDIKFPDRAIREGKEAIRNALEDIVEVETTRAFG